jgi:hypothetical protein
VTVVGNDSLHLHGYVSTYGECIEILLIEIRR